MPKRAFLALAAALTLATPAEALNVTVQQGSPPYAFGSPPGNILCVLGDSIYAQGYSASNGTAFAVTTNLESPRGPGFWATFLTHGAVISGSEHNYAVPGYTTDNVIATSLPLILADPACSVYLMLNAVYNGLNAGTTAAHEEANMLQIVQELRAKGHPVILQANFVGGLTSTKLQYQLATNYYAKTVLGGLSGVYYFDSTRDSWQQQGATPTALSGYTYDGLHPELLGAYPAYKQLGPILNLLFPPAPEPANGIWNVYDSTNNIHGNLIAANSPLTGTGGTTTGTCVSGNVATGWTILATGGGSQDLSSATCAGSIVTKLGKVFQQIAISGTATGDYHTFVSFYVPVTGMVAGQSYRAACTVEQNAPVTNMGGLSLNLWVFDGTNKVQAGMGEDSYFGGTNLGPEPSYSPDAEIDNGMFETDILVIPPGFTTSSEQLEFNIFFQNASSLTVAETVRIGNCAVWQL
ncbi:MAG TPA: SGNH/GDSL hydrolase family protein [Rhodanobacter sp.]|nr:SGNH/GDSL hydrolase family protein [Rhodanobacter sp.]